MIPFFKPSLSLWIGIAVIAASIAAVYLHFRNDAQTRERLEVMTAERDDTKRLLVGARRAVNACMQVNLENAQARDRENQRAIDAEARTAEAEQDANREILEMQSEIARLRDRDLDCPAIDSEFRDWVRDNP